LKKLFFLLLFLSLILSLFILSKRFSIENSNREIEICLDWSSFYIRSQEENYPWEEFLLKIRNYGISSFGLEEETFAEIKEKVYIFPQEEREKLILLGLIAPSALPQGETWVFNDRLLFSRMKDILEKRLNRTLPIFKRGEYFFLSLPSGLNYTDFRFGYNKEKIEQARDYGLKVLLQADFTSSFTLEEILSSDLQGSISGITFKEGSNRDISFPQVGFFKEKIKFALPEFINHFQLKKFRQLNSSLVRLHYLGPQEYSLYQKEVTASWRIAQDKLLRRLVRAVKERNVRLLYLYPLPRVYLSSKSDYFTEQYTFFSQLEKNLAKENFELAVSNPFPQVNFPPEKTKFLRQFLALYIACLFPFLGLKFFFPPKKVIVNFLLFCFISLTAGILISTLLSGNEFFLKLDEFRGTKVALVLPILLALIYLYRDNWRDIFSQKVSIGQFLIFLIISLIFILFFIRSGESASSLLPGEDRLRSFFENIFWVRPRIKEFLFGHPLLILGFFLVSRPLIILGLIGQVSIINTFIHLHTPFFVSVYRVLVGIFLGTFFGLLLVKSYQVFLRRWQKF